MKIEASELRLKNYIEHNGKYYQVEQIGDEWLKLDNDQLNTEVNKCQPIPITEDIFFKKINTSYINKSVKFIVIDEISYYFKDDRVECYVTHQDKPTAIFNTVHEFQNLHYCLTKKELEINL